MNESPHSIYNFVSILCVYVCIYLLCKRCDLMLECELYLNMKLYNVCQCQLYLMHVEKHSAYRKGHTDIPIVMYNYKPTLYCASDTRLAVCI